MNYLKAIPIIAIPVMSGCTTPDVSDEVKLLDTAVASVAEPLGKTLDADLENETERARDAWIAAGNRAYGTAEECDKASRGSLEASISECKLQPRFEVPDQRGTARYAKEAFSVIEAYAATITAIVDSETPSGIQAELEGLLGSSNEFKVAVRGSDDANFLNEDDIAPVARMVGRLSEAARYRALKRLVNDADEPLELVLRELIAHQEKNDRILDAFEKLRTAESNMFDAEDSDRATYAAKVSDYEEEMKDFRDTVKDSQYGRLLLIWKAQKALLAAVNDSKMKPEDAIALIEDIKLLSDT